MGRNIADADLQFRMEVGKDYMCQYYNKRLKCYIIILKHSAFKQPQVYTIRKGRMHIRPNCMVVYNSDRHVEFFYWAIHPNHAHIETIIFQHNGIIYSIPYKRFMEMAYCTTAEESVAKKVYVSLTKAKDYII